MTPRPADILWAFGQEHQKQGRHHEAARFYAQALHANPVHLLSLTSLAGLAQLFGDTPTSAHLFTRALAVAPQHPRVLQLAASFAIDQGDYERAQALLAYALPLHPYDETAIDPTIRILRAMHAEERLRQDDYSWLHEWCLWREKTFCELEGHGQHGPTVLLAPLWHGAPLPQGTLFLRAHAGYGDTFMNVRFLVAARKRVSKVILCLDRQPELTRLLQMQRWKEVTITTTMPSAGAYDAYLPIEGLMGLFCSSPQKIPPSPRLRLDARLVAAWRQRLRPLAGSFTIGICWGASVSPSGKARIARLLDFAPLAQVPGVRFVSLQKGPFAA